ncbi:Ubiquitin-conjugating enzyme E2 R2 [Cichlidogyrus casuarinus]|uniref:Ubiquitin-conjugating enzyme E2 R2 n=1 Tax=Cichlidogyrus casuarinus TaxID=1844966 RepID=A0ABD2QGE5_9PLAT
MAASLPQSTAIRALQKELKSLIAQPVEGFSVKLVDESNLFVWDVAIFGPPQTIYEGGYFKARLFFPPEYPYLPPTMKFITRMFHPNIYENGDVCISILHAPGEDPRSGEMASERWSPVQNVRTILLSVISMLNEPNIHSSAHINASTAYRDWRESNGLKADYERTVRGLVEQTRSDALIDGVTVPTTLEEYCISGSTKGLSSGTNFGYNANMSGILADDALDLDDDYFDDDDEEDEDDMETDEQVEEIAPKSMGETSVACAGNSQLYVEDGLIDEGHVTEERDASNEANKVDLAAHSKNSNQPSEAT